MTDIYRILCGKRGVSLHLCEVLSHARQVRPCVTERQVPTERRALFTVFMIQKNVMWLEVEWLLLLELNSINNVHILEQIRLWINKDFIVWYCRFIVY